MKKLIVSLVLLTFIVSCKTSDRMPSQNEDTPQTEQDTVVIANDELEYEIIIIEPGFNAWLLGVAKPEGYYSQEFMENKNQFFVSEWNRRVLQPSVYNPRLYELQIDYSPFIDYGYEVNYKLYNYFLYFQQKYKQQL